jgi:hypothetical protein
MMSAWFALTAIVAGSLTPTAQTPGQDPALRIILTDAGRGASANISLGPEPGHVWADPARCGIGASSTATSGSVALAWRVTGRVTAQQADVYTVELEWSRVAGGPAASDAMTSPRTLTLRLDERVLVDRAPVSGTCGWNELRLEVIVGRAAGGTTVTSSGRGPAGRGGGFGTGRGGGGGAAVAGATRPGSSATTVSGGRGGAGGGGTTTTTTMTSRPGVSAAAGGGGGRGAGRGGGGGAAAMAAPPGSVITLRPSDPPVDVELWLVHHAGANEPGQVELKTVRIGTPFAFAATPLTTAKGPVLVEVSGSIYERLLNGTPDGLVVEIKRRVKGDGADYLGSSSRHIPMPAAAEVVSFPIPNGSEAARVPVAGESALPSALLLQGHTFELRLRIKTK